MNLPSVLCCRSRSLDVEAGRRGSEYWERDLMTNEQPLENVLLLSLLPDVVITL